MNFFPHGAIFCIFACFSQAREIQLLDLLTNHSRTFVEHGEILKMLFVFHKHLFSGWLLICIIWSVLLQYHLVGSEFLGNEALLRSRENSVIYSVSFTNTVLCPVTASSGFLVVDGLDYN